MSVKEITLIMDAPSDEDIDLIDKAYHFAEKAHKNHKRRSGEPFFTHLYETAKTLAELGMGPKAVSAGFLHDSIEDVGVTEEQIEKEFGAEVLAIVQGVTKLGELKYHGTSRHIESLRKLFVATSEDIRVLIVKLADRLHNMKTLDHIPKEKQKRIALETLEVYAPVADRLGMGKLKRELEDLAFPYVYPKEHQTVVDLLKERDTQSLKQLEKFHKAVKKELASQGIRDFTTECRMKGLYSLFKKLERKDWDIHKIHDISAVRIILNSTEECYKVLGIIHNVWRPLPGEIKDYIAFEKPNGYRSLHTKVFTGGGIIEVQIRTKRMHHEAQYGIAAHVSYKTYLNDPSQKSNLVWIRQFLPSIMGLAKQKTASKPLRKDKTVQKYLTTSVPEWIKQIAETQESAAKSEEFMNTLRTDFFSHRVFVFTPKGEVIDLPIDSNPIDFAYAIHSDIGDHVARAKVNGKMVSLDTKLMNGDWVEIETKESSWPTKKWLEMVKTSLARKGIRNALQKNNK